MTQNVSILVDEFALKYILDLLDVCFYNTLVSMRWILIVFVFLSSPAFSKECDILARVYEHNICMPNHEFPEDKLWSHIFLEAVKIKYKKHLVPTAEEKEKLIKSSINLCVRQRETRDMGPEEMYSFMMKTESNYDESQSHFYAECNKESEKDLHRDPIYKFFELWKINKVLWDEYGGGVAFQQAGLEPHDAFRKFYEDMKINGSLSILKPQYADTFKHFDSYLKRFSSLGPESEASEYFKEFFLFKKLQ